MCGKGLAKSTRCHTKHLFFLSILLGKFQMEHGTSFLWNKDPCTQFFPPLAKPSPSSASSPSFHLQILPPLTTTQLQAAALPGNSSPFSVKFLLAPVAQLLYEEDILLGWPIFFFYIDVSSLVGYKLSGKWEIVWFVILSPCRILHTKVQRKNICQWIKTEKKNMITALNLALKRENVFLNPTFALV